MPKMTEPGSEASKTGPQGQRTGVESDSERQLVSSLAKLQKLETMVCSLDWRGEEGRG